MSKGKRRERQAAELYERAGYETFRPQESKFGETDMFGLYDILAVPTHDTDNDTVRLAQVKSNRAAGVEEWVVEAATRLNANMYGDFLVCHDREGWRLLSAEPRSPFDLRPENAEPVTFVDERDGFDPYNSHESVGKGTSYEMGEGVVEYLGGDVDD